jgi:hypothetical protein
MRSNGRSSKVKTLLVYGVTECEVDIMPALYYSLGTMGVLGLGDDFDSGADRNEVVEFDHVGVT